MKTRQMVMALLGMIFKVAVAIIVVFFVYRAALVAYDYGYRIFQETPVSEAPGIDIQVEITVGKSPLQVGEILEERGLIRDAKLFYIQYLLSKYKDKMQAGSYVLNTSMTMQEMMAVMSVESSESETKETTSDESTDETTDDNGDEIPEETENNDDNG